MSTTLRNILFVLLFSLITTIQFNLDADKTATRQIKNALELAVHDAALAISDLDLSSGRFIFDRNQAIENFKYSIEQNLKVESNAGFIYTPLENSFFKEPLYVSHFDVIDDTVTLTYPYVYINDQFNIVETIDGPSIIAVMVTESPRYFVGEPIAIRQAAVYEYKR